MSQVFSFRLDRNNPREALVIQLIERWREEGFSLRQIFIEALLKSDEPPSSYGQTEIIHEMNAKLETIERLLEQGGHSAPVAPRHNSESGTDSLLSDTFIAAIKSSVKPGIMNE